jgi:hypothetical protein
VLTNHAEEVKEKLSAVVKAVLTAHIYKTITVTES